MNLQVCSLVSVKWEQKMFGRLFTFKVTAHFVILR